MRARRVAAGSSLEAQVSFPLPSNFFGFPYPSPATLNLLDYPPLVLMLYTLVSR